MRAHLVRTVIAGAVLAAAAITATGTAAATPSGGQCPGGVLDDCYTKAEMMQYLDVAVGMINTYLDQISPGVRPAAVVFIPTSRQVTSACVNDNGSAAADASAYQYCAADNSVYIGQEEMWKLYESYGAISPVVALAHEYGHFAQDLVGIPDPHSPAESIPHENQADCFAGAFARHLDARGNLEYGKDLTNVGELMQAVGSPEGPGRTHGTPEERRASFARGFDGNLGACNAYYPANPLTV
ncbi:neutral zinc metallopeptidase [Rhodococcus aetherivorans]